jgi:bacterioferritin-associated ferredoxin
MNDLHGRGPDARAIAAFSVLTIILIRVNVSPMIVCVCKAVSDRHIRSAVESGASCIKELSMRTGLGTCCGKCVPHAKMTLDHCLARDGGGFSLAAPVAA